MERIMEGFSNLGWQQVVFAACVAYVVTYIYRVFARRQERKKNGEKVIVIKTLDRRAYDRCAELFPIDKITFRGREFTRGMKIRVTTIQKNVIEGELIGLNQSNLVCIKTGNKIIAHQMEKIEEITAAK